MRKGWASVHRAARVGIATFAVQKITGRAERLDEGPLKVLPE